MRPLGNIVSAIAQLRLPRECKSILFENVLLTRFEKAMCGLRDATGYPAWTTTMLVPVRHRSVPARRIAHARRHD